MPASEGISSQILKIWNALLNSLPDVLRDRWKVKDIRDFVRLLREASGPDEVLKILIDVIKAGDPKQVLILLSTILRLINIMWPESPPIIRKVVEILRWIAESFEEAASQEGVGR